MDENFQIYHRLLEKRKLSEELKYSFFSPGAANIAKESLMCFSFSARFAFTFGVIIIFRQHHQSLLTKRLAITISASLNSR
jgi:hypothetical protein